MFTKIINVLVVKKIMYSLQFSQYCSEIYMFYISHNLICSILPFFSETDLLSHGDLTICMF